jgi:hypothetical protein
LPPMTSSTLQSRPMCCHRFIAVIVLAVSLMLGAKKRPEPAAADPSAPPADAQWTIYCQAVAGPDHVARANALKEQLIEVTHLKPWHVIHQEDQSVLYYGYYKTINDPKDKKETTRAKNDRQTIADLKDAAGNKVFGAAMFVEVSAPDPQAPPQWDLRNAPGYWSVEIAMYKEHPQRKQAAIDTVRDARAQGVDAYYYHGPTASSVCIGAWPKEAVREQESAAEYNQDPSQDLLVLPQPVTDNTEFRNRDGQKITTVAPRIEPVDPSLIAAMDKYKERSVNGEVYMRTVEDPVTKQQQQIADPVVLVRIPAPTGPSLLRQSQPPPQLVTPVSPSQTPGAGKLKSIGQ